MVVSPSHSCSSPSTTASSPFCSTASHNSSSILPSRISSSPFYHSNSICITDLNQNFEKLKSCLEELCVRNGCGDSISAQIYLFSSLHIFFLFSRGVFVEVEMMNFWKNKKKLKMMKIDEGCMKVKMREKDEKK
ncbi:transmembrane protein, putative [Medicago truncatula]|uniref:Transmembrane protein, putative n=1 Tax=Medicago truncatula TaxID=3880 RepID=A0A072VQ99_MEDTR|nr:transmembrane protein, putative [Medicago truncatula]